MTKTIELTQGKVALVSDNKYEYLNRWKWCAVFKRGKWRAMRKQWFPTIKTIYMHRAIMNITDPKILIDHKDGNGLNNCKSNLRIVTTAQNSMNAKKAANKSSIYKGVCFHKREKKWYAYIRKNYKLISLGYFNEEIEAAKAYNEKAKELFGEFANLNAIP